MAKYPLLGDYRGEFEIIITNTFLPQGEVHFSPI